MRALEFLTEAQVPPVRDQIRADYSKSGGDIEDYFVRFTDVDRLGFSARQAFARTPDADDPRYDNDYIGAGQGRRALWFYPLAAYLRDVQGFYATDKPYLWLVKIKPTAWLQPMARDERGVQPAPEGQRRVGMFKQGNPPMAIFFEPAFDVVGRYYDYAGQHQRHGQVRGRPAPSFFDRVRGAA
jgi:hypothetical protein